MKTILFYTYCIGCVFAMICYLLEGYIAKKRKKDMSEFCEMFAPSVFLSWIYVFLFIKHKTI